MWSDIDGTSSMRLVQTVIITGMSGSGKSTALKAFEDMGYFCVDNLPIILLPEFLSFTESTSKGPTKVALVMDIREETFLEQYRFIFSKLKRQGFHLEILFVDAKEDVLLRRYSQTRRHHPLEQSGEVLKGIRLERKKMRDLRESADKLLDTSDLNVHQLRHSIFDLYAPRMRLDRMVVHILSFGFKYGLPADANLVFDVRFLPNPYFEDSLRKLSGMEADVRNFVLGQKDTMEFLSRSEELLQFLLPRYRNEGKSYLVIAVGCTGGRHRSVVITEYLRDKFVSYGEEVIVSHRDIDREA
ncbi:MAG: RNase adapter RapZ [Dissulfurimicrobium sp.]|uniref:RNase adapter RapZ n=1 Tax=Dissulfurimicrobium TaxID=1769732 RepID=UPI001EDB2321|nr:RNase adapter RapZ [Dissulfurimicrobium hydrothermale]UKL13510.1 RNase adapter RapZ [Dissulfurimicrobium hydrothermale]